MNSETPPIPATVKHFTQPHSSTRRGARLARLLTTGALQTWNVPPAVAERAEHIVAELAANAVFHGRVCGRDFRLGLTLDPAAGTLRVEVTDARGARRPGNRPDVRADGEARAASRGRTRRQLVTDPFPPSGKTVWSELDVSGG